MPARTDFNVSPYWDTFAQTNDFYRVLFRPGFAVQARELTTLQTILQNQIEQFGNHFFKEGTIVIPGSVAYDNQYSEGETPSDGSDVGGYNIAWMDPGTELFQLFGKYRTSIVAHPKNGKIPWDRQKADKFFQKLRKDRSRRRDHPELRGVVDRCVVGFGSSGGPPMINVLYIKHDQSIIFDNS